MLMMKQVLSVLAGSLVWHDSIAKGKAIEVGQHLLETLTIRSENLVLN